MKNYQFRKYAGSVVDIHDDTSKVFWNKVAQFWPDYLDLPEDNFDKTACIAYVEGEPKFPVDSPENTLASSFYFLANAGNFDKSAALEIGGILKKAREAWGVSVPSDFIDFLKMGSFKAPTVISLDKDKNLPADTIEELEASAEFFDKNATEWDARERILVNYNIEKRAAELGVEKAAKWRKSEVAEEAILLREEFMQGIRKHSMRNEYIKEAGQLRELVAECANDDVGRLAYLAEQLEGLDKRAQMDIMWDTYFPPPFESLVGMEKTSKWDNFDWDGLGEVFSSDVVDQIKEDPDNVVPTLPAPQKALFEDYCVRTRSK